MKKRSDKSRPHGGRILVITAVLLAIALLLLAMSLLDLRRSPLQVERNGFQMGNAAGSVVCSAGNGVAAAGSSGIWLFTSTGKQAAADAVSLRDPLAAGCSLVAAFADRGGTELHALYPEGSARSTATDGAVSSLDVNPTGLITVISDIQGTSCSVMVYDTNLTPLFRWNALTGVPAAARTSEQDLLCVGVRSGENSVLRLFRIDREEELASVVLPGEAVSDLGFFSDGSVCALTGRRLVFFSPELEELASFSLEGKLVAAHAFSGRFAALAVSEENDGSEPQLLSFDSAGVLLGRLVPERDVLVLSASGERLLVLFSGRESTLYDLSLAEDVSFQPPESTRQCILSPEGVGFYCGDDGIYRLLFR